MFHHFHVRRFSSQSHDPDKLDKKPKLHYNFPFFCTELRVGIDRLGLLALLDQCVHSVIKCESSEYVEWDVRLAVAGTRLSRASCL